MYFQFLFRKRIFKINNYLIINLVLQTSEGSAPPSKKKKTGARKKVNAAFIFDFKNPPEKVSWCLSYATEDVWSPSMGDWNVPLATKQEWAAVFNHVCQNQMTQCVSSISY